MNRVRSSLVVLGPLVALVVMTACHGAFDPKVYAANPPALFAASLKQRASSSSRTISLRETRCSLFRITIWVNRRKSRATICLRRRASRAFRTRFRTTVLRRPRYWLVVARTPRCGASRSWTRPTGLPRKTPSSRLCLCIRTRIWFPRQIARSRVLITCSLKRI